MAHCSDIEHSLDMAEPKEPADPNLYTGDVPEDMQLLSPTAERALAMAKKAADRGLISQAVEVVEPAEPLMSDEELARILDEPEDVQASLGGGRHTYYQTGKLGAGPVPTESLTSAQKNANARAFTAEHRSRTAHERHHRGRP